MTHSLSQFLDLRRLIWGQPYIDINTLAAAIESEVQHNAHPDYRTRLLIHDAAQAIRSFWGTRKFNRWLADSPARDHLLALLDEPFAETGFPNIRGRLVDNIGDIPIKQIFTLLGQPTC